MAKQKKKRACYIQPDDIIYLPKERKRVTITEVVPDLIHGNPFIKWGSEGTVINAYEEVIYY
ncbi:MAG: hypothetical protein KME45_27640 [Stenomitos rutilans HA7619-LM2]|jgi:hypothetical protein|nr:hypothetical protein [Stenomitos rutilans HA7619-LM2]